MGAARYVLSSSPHPSLAIVLPLFFLSSPIFRSLFGLGQICVSPTGRINAEMRPPVRGSYLEACADVALSGRGRYIEIKWKSETRAYNYRNGNNMGDSGGNRFRGPRRFNPRPNTTQKYTFTGNGI